MLYTVPPFQVVDSWHEDYRDVNKTPFQDQLDLSYAASND